jgi:hypothetical protein
LLYSFRGGITDVQTEKIVRKYSEKYAKIHVYNGPKIPVLLYCILVAASENLTDARNNALK